jgi:hypothetical protein
VDPVGRPARDGDDTGSFVDATLQDIRTNTGMTFGLRLGHWADPLPFVGLGLDVCYFSVPIPGQTVQATGLAVSPLKFLALFAEYRYSFFPDYQLKNRNVTYEADVDTHHVVPGASLRF